MMKSKVKSEKNIKIKVFLSYALIFILISVILYFTFNSFQQLTRSTDRLAQPNERIELLHEIIFSIYVAESNIRSYGLTEQTQFLNTYFEELTHINQMVDTLYVLAQDDPFALSIIDSINFELFAKTRLLDQLIQIRRADRSSAYYQQALEDVLSATGEERTLREVTHQSIVDESEEENVEIIEPEDIAVEKNNFFSRIRNFFSGGRDEKPDQASEKEKPEPVLADEMLKQIRTDSIITVYRDTDKLRGEIETAMSSLFQRLYRNQENIRRRENAILLEDKAVMDRIWEFVSQLKNHEENIALREAENAHLTVNQTTEIIFLIIALSMVVLLFFSILFINDINKSRYYKKQLMEQTARAEELVLVKQRFMANMSHEIRTPLNSIIGFSSQLRKHPKARKAAGFIEAIHLSSRHLLEIVNDILDFSKMEAGKIKLEKVPVDLVEITEQINLALSDMATEKELEFITDTLELTSRYYYCDPVRVRQILFNLTGNAIKFTHQGWIRITLKSDSANLKGKITRGVSIVVADSGIGIEKDQQKLIFDEFAQADNQSTRRYGGTGLGLSITNNLVEMMGGTIKLESEPDKGTIFRVFLPMAEAPAIEEREVVEEETEILLSELSGKILLADDDRLNRMLVKTLLESFPNVQVTEAEDGTTAWELIQEKDFDLLITDIQMPGMSGMELSQRIRSSDFPVNPQMPVIACTADTTPETLSAMKEAGINDYIAKPLDENSFRDTMVKYLSLIDEWDNEIENEEDVDRPEEEEVIDTLPNGKLYDLEGLYVFTGKNRETTNNILDAFYNDTIQNIDLLEGFILNPDPSEIHSLVHKMSHMFDLLQVKTAMPFIKKLNRTDLAKLPQNEILNNVKGLLLVAKQLVAKITVERESQTIG